MRAPARSRSVGSARRRRRGDGTWGAHGRLSDRDRLELADARLKLQNDLRATALQAIGGLAVLAGAVLAFQQVTDDRQQATAARD